MKVMERVGQFKWNKDGVPAEGGGRRRRRIGTCGYAGRKVVFFSFKFKTRNRVFSWEGWGALGKWGK